MKKLILLVTALIFLVGCSEATAEVEGEAVNYENLKSMNEEAKEELSELGEQIEGAENDLSSIRSELNNEESEFEALIKLAENQEEVEEEVSEAESTLENLQEDIESAEDELEELEGSVVEKKEEPTTISAGHYIVGEDIPAGRYVAESSGGGGNFSSHNTSDRLNFSTILGDGERRESEYVFWAESGDQLKLGVSINFTEIE
ncbi:septal ring factor EnvC (AmiA/AmiB activator) [Virgibacillus natechei]|uniref:Septal ring factor EnvC (AmiA/AmiB activator) n=1 Tax=Virgibacillus natechei TaxID=1216297 RepID=A0ABS4IBA2_9BACI|nr:hypothetical protein [Virgibacillus natechei]MBP1968160.1 septal ring factor EnvC (AmiA/AmiB activator) [Virgibacillus natechei]UZD14564.1 hypothetical protein OLD84_08745 [Virgibacillus natechei]